MEIPLKKKHRSPPLAGRACPQASQVSSFGGFSKVHQLQAHTGSGIFPEEKTTQTHLNKSVFF